MSVGLSEEVHLWVLPCAPLWGIRLLYPLSSLLSAECSTLRLGSLPCFVPTAAGNCVHSCASGN